MRSTQRLARRSPRTPAVNLEQRHDRPRSSSWDVGPGARPGPAPAEPGTGSPCRRGDYSEGETTPLLGMRLGSRISLVGWPRSSSSVRGTHRSPSATSCHRAQRSTGVLDAPTHPTTHGSLTSTARRFDSSGHQVTRSRLLPGWWTTPNEWCRSACERGPNRAPVAYRGWSSQSARSTLWSGWTMVVRAG